jgi:hypothetical protein|tara:strand:+ start:4803 stop:5837 length:1035 start_codon:yes stop_codon:yes gene_type:complete
MNIKGQFNNNRGFGVEVEFIRPNNVSKQDICDALTVNCRVEGYNHITRPHWKIVSDSSVSANGRRGYVGDNEIVSPILYGENGFVQLKSMLDTLKQLECEVNYTCGIHVHHDVTNMMVQGKEKSQKFLANLVKFVAKYEHLIYKLVSPSRLDNRQYSTPVRREYFSYDLDVTKNDVKKMINKVKNDCNRKYNRGGNVIDRDQPSPNVQHNRACGLNFRNVWTRGSVEFRYHNGSLNFEKIVSWIVFTQAIVNAVEDTKSVSMSFVPNNIKGLASLRGAIGFIRRSGMEPTERTVFSRDEYVNLSNKYVQKRYKELSRREADYEVNMQYRYVKDGLTTNQQGGLA